VQPAETAAEDDDVGSPGRCRRHRPIVSQRQRAKPMTSSSGGTASSLA
jgi:hypothetical protein